MATASAMRPMEYWARPSAPRTRGSPGRALSSARYARSANRYSPASARPLPSPSRKSGLDLPASTACFTAAAAPAASPSSPNRITRSTWVLGRQGWASSALRRVASARSAASPRALRRFSAAAAASCPGRRAAALAMILAALPACPCFSWATPSQ